MNSQVKATGSAILDTALAIISERFEKPLFPGRLFYHNTSHTLGVRERALLIAHAMGLSEREMRLIEVAACFHDSVQVWVPANKDDGVIMRQRVVGQNEAASAHEACEAMSSLDVTFTPEEKGVVASAIIATIPGWSQEHKTVTQPFLTPCSRAVVRAVALADLGEAGMDPDSFVRTGPLVFAEDQLDLMQALSAAQRTSDIPPRQQEWFRKRLIGWLNIQVGFAAGRKAMLDAELEGLSPEAKTHVKALFSRFDESIEAAGAALARAETMAFVPLMRILLPEAFLEEDK